MVVTRSAHKAGGQVTHKKKKKRPSSKSNYSQYYDWTQSNLKAGSPPRTMSKLYRAVLDLWLAFLREKSWPFSFEPGPMSTPTETTHSEPVLKRIIDGRDLQAKADPDCAEEAIVPGAPGGTLHRDKSQRTEEEKHWVEARHLFGFQRDVFDLWKLGLSDRDLDRLVESDTVSHRILGRRLLELMMRLGALLKNAISPERLGERGPEGEHISANVDTATDDDHKPVDVANSVASTDDADQEMPVDEDLPALPQTARRLDRFTKEFSKMIRDSHRLNPSGRPYRPPPETTTPAELLSRVRAINEELGREKMIIEMAVLKMKRTQMAARRMRLGSPSLTSP